MKYGVNVFVTDFGTVKMPEAVDAWIKEKPYKHKEGGRVHKRRMKDREARICQAVNTLAHINWQQGNDAETLSKALEIISVKSKV